jgi:DnaK suppressor protein
MPMFSEGSATTMKSQEFRWTTVRSVRRGQTPVSRHEGNQGGIVSTTLDWSDSRKRSRFTTGGGPAVVAVPATSLRDDLEQIHAWVESEAYVVDVRRSALRRRLDEIDAALGRIADGSYGTCEGCGRAVSCARLKACPETRLCSSCETRWSNPTRSILVGWSR